MNTADYSREQTRFRFRSVLTLSKELKLCLEESGESFNNFYRRMTYLNFFPFIKCHFKIHPDDMGVSRDYNEKMKRAQRKCCENIDKKDHTK